MRLFVLTLALPLTISPALAQESQAFQMGKGFAEENKGGVSSEQMDALPETEGDAAHQKSLFQGGKGDAAGPGIARISQCAPTEGDPECDAINLMNQGEAQSSEDFALSGADEAMVEDANEIKDNAESIVGPDTNSEAACVQTTVETPENVTKQRCEVFRHADAEECRVERAIEVERQVAYECEDGYSQDLYSCTKEYKYEWVDGIGLDRKWTKDLKAYSFSYPAGIFVGEDQNGNPILRVTNINSDLSTTDVIRTYRRSDGAIIKEKVVGNKAAQVKLNSAMGATGLGFYLPSASGTVEILNDGMVVRTDEGDSVLWSEPLSYFSSHSRILNRQYHPETNSIIVIVSYFKSYEHDAKLYAQSIDFNTGKTNWMSVIRSVDGHSGFIGYGRAELLPPNQNVLEVTHFYNNAGSYRINRLDPRTGNMLLSQSISSEDFNSSVRYVYQKANPAGSFYYTSGPVGGNYFDYRVNQVRRNDNTVVASWSPPTYSCSGKQCRKTWDIMATDLGDVYVIYSLAGGVTAITRLQSRGQLNALGWEDHCEGLK